MDTEDVVLIALDRCIESAKLKHPSVFQLLKRKRIAHLEELQILQDSLQLSFDELMVLLTELEITND